MFVESIENTGVRDFGFCAQGDNPVCQGRKRLPEEECGSQEQRMAVWRTLNESWKSKMEVPVHSLTLPMRKLALSALIAVSAFAQKPAPPAFEVASVKINQQQPFVDADLKVSGNSLIIRNRNMRVIAAWAYSLQWSQIAGPSWIDSDRFDIIAKADKPLTEDQMRPLLQTLLAERFHFASHGETRQTDVLALTVPKGGHKITPSKKTEGPTESHQDPARGLVIEGATLAELCENLSHDSHSILIVDMTGLTGRFDFAFNIQKYQEALRARAMSEPRPTSEADLIVGFMQDLISGELGLKVDERRAPVEFLVIDRADQKPVEN